MELGPRHSQLRPGITGLPGPAPHLHRVLSGVRLRSVLGPSLSPRASAKAPLQEGGAARVPHKESLRLLAGHRLKLLAWVALPALESVSTLLSRGFGSHLRSGTGLVLPASQCLQRSRGSRAKLSISLVSPSLVSLGTAPWHWLRTAQPLQKPLWAQPGPRGSDVAC